MMTAMEMKTSLNEEYINNLDMHLFKKKYDILIDLLNPEKQKKE